MFKKSNILCCGGLQLLNPPTSTVSPSRLHGMRDRKYATASDFPSREYSWPTATSFTPYDVFNLQRGASYSKNRYYDLVKIYHPDRPGNDSLPRELTPEVRLQRYRIIVAAHEILSDPSKRAAYDLHGTGWVHGPKRYNTVAEATAEWGPYGSTIYANATWEDWERWHNRDQGPQRHFVDHRTFTRLVVLLLLFGGAVNASWIGHVSNGYEQRLQEVNEETTRLLIGRRHNTVHQMDSNDARVQGFLIRRDPSGSGLQDEEHSIYQKELTPRSGHPAGPEHVQTVDAEKSDST